MDNTNADNSILETPRADSTEKQESQTSKLPTAELMLDRLQSIDLSYFNKHERTDEAKGQHAWIFVLTMPASALLLVILTFLGALITDQLIISFVVSAGLVYSIAKLIDNYEQRYVHAGRLLMMQKIADFEGDLGLLYHFKEFLPKKYRHLWQSVRSKNFIFVEQYVSAIHLLQTKLDTEKFIKLWHLKYPLTDPEYVEAMLTEEAEQAKRKAKRNIL